MDEPYRCEHGFYITEQDILMRASVRAGLPMHESVMTEYSMQHIRTCTDPQVSAAVGETLKEMTYPFQH